uniref:Uncharacterized protein n=1 Tax=Lactuca sativa TaxID=4236 RepID=A0A9R1VHH3_LACSA|nr:hypothetical protein LSAT_V11C500277750 [Lactuca sativa]
MSNLCSEEMKSSLQGKKKYLFVMYPRFLQMVLNEKYPQIERSSNTLDMKALGPNTFGLMKQSRKAAKVPYQGLKELLSLESLLKFKTILLLVEISDDEEEEVQDNNMIVNELENFLQSISIPEEDMDALITELQRTARKPPQIFHVTTEPPSESNQEDSSHVLLLMKRKRRDPRPGVLITYLFKISVAQNIESAFIESSPVLQEISSPLPESTPMDQDFESPIVEQESKLPEFEFVDVALLQNKDIRTSDLEKENSIKDANISELQANLGGLTALFFDLKQRLHQTFGDDFQPLSVEGDKISASSSVPVNSTSQPASGRVVRPTADANLDTFLFSGPTSGQERREKLIRVKQLRGKMLVMKHSDQNAPGDHPKIFLRETGKKFTDKYWDRSGILMWGYEFDKKMWIVKRKSGRDEYYEKKVDFFVLDKSLSFGTDPRSFPQSNQ